jgi:hypothetical protein
VCTLRRGRVRCRDGLSLLSHSLLIAMNGLVLEVSQAEVDQCEYVGHVVVLCPLLHGGVGWWVAVEEVGWFEVAMNDGGAFGWMGQVSDGAKESSEVELGLTEGQLLEV